MSTPAAIVTSTVAVADVAAHYRGVENFERELATADRPRIRLFTVPNPNSADDFMDVLNPDSLETVDAFLEPALADVSGCDPVQF